MDDNTTTPNSTSTPHPSPRAQRLWVAVVLACVAVVVLGVARPAAAQTTTTAPSADATQQLSWSVRPIADGTDRANFEYVLAPGTAQRDILQVTNRSNVPIALNVYASDAFTTPTGGIDLLPASETPVDGGSWITVAAPVIEVPPGQVVDVPFTLSVPAGAEPGDHPAGIVTSLVSDGVGADGSPVRVDRRLGSRIHIRVEGPLHPRFELETTEVLYKGDWNPFTPGSVEVTYTVKNTGNVRLRASQRIQTSGPFNLLKQSTDPDDTAEILPGFSLTYTETVPKVWPTGRITTQLVVAPYSESRGPISPAPQAVLASTQISAMPWPQMVLLAVVVVVFVLWIWRRRRRQRQVDVTVEKAVTRALAAAGVTPVVDADVTDGAEGQTTRRAKRAKKSKSAEAPSEATGPVLDLNAEDARSTTPISDGQDA